ncbi:MAG: hypothetical protein ACYDAO_10245 [Thermoplasmataceae archaeon]
MNQYFNAFISELKKNVYEMIRTYIWIFGILIFIGVSIFSSLPNSYENFKFLNDPYPMSYFFYIFFGNLLKNGGVLVILILSAIVISEDVESGRWTLLTAFKLPINSIIIGKFVWLLIFITICVICSTLIFSAYMFTKYYQFNEKYIYSILETIMITIFVLSIVAVQGMFFSSIFSKKITSVISVLGYYFSITFISFYLNSLYLNPSSTNLRNTPHFNKSGWSIASPNFSYFSKFIFLLNPYYMFHYYGSIIIGIFALNPITNSRPSNGFVPSLIVTLIFIPSNGYDFLIVYLIQFILFASGMVFVLYLKSKVN